MDLIETVHPVTTVDVAEALKAATRRNVAVLPVGGRRHLDTGNPGRVDVELFAVLPLSTFVGGAAASALVKVPFSMMLKPAHSWSAVTMTRVWPSRLAKSMATFTASSKALVSSSVWAASLACDRLSMSAPSTWR